MIEVDRTPDGGLLVRGISPMLADTMLRVPIWLESQDPRVRGRLLPETYADTDDEKQWRRLGVPDLEHLFRSRSELIRRDLRTLAEDRDGAFAVAIPASHASAWLSGLNGARLALFALHDLQQEDMERDPAALEDLERGLAILRIHALAILQEMLLEAGG